MNVGGSNCGIRSTAALILSLFAPPRPLANEHGSDGDHGNHGDDGRHNFKIAPPDKGFRGLSYGQWQAAGGSGVSVPIMNGTHPLSPGRDVRQGQSGRVWFLGARPRRTPQKSATSRFDKGPPCFPDRERGVFHGRRLSICRHPRSRAARVRQGLHGPHPRGACRDRRPADREAGAVPSSVPLFTIKPLPEHNILGLDAGTTGQSVDDGVYLMVLLEEGQHTLRFGGSFDTSDLPGFPDVSRFDVIYHVTVVD